MCKKCNKDNCCCVKVITKAGPRGQIGPKGNTGPKGDDGANGLDGAATVNYVSEGIIAIPEDLGSGLAVCPVTITTPGDYVFDFTIWAACQSSASDTFELRTFIRKNGVNPITVDNYTHITILPKSSGLGVLTGATHNHKVRLTGLIAGDIIAFWCIGFVNMKGAAMTYVKQ